MVAKLGHLRSQKGVSRPDLPFNQMVSVPGAAKDGGVGGSKERLQQLKDVRGAEEVWWRLEVQSVKCLPCEHRDRVSSLVVCA